MRKTVDALGSMLDRTVPEGPRELQVQLAVRTELLVGEASG